VPVVVGQNANTLAARLGLGLGSPYMRSLTHRTERCGRALRVTAPLTLSLVLLASACLAPGAMAADTIYWTTPYAANVIYVAKLDGSSSTPPATLATGAATVSSPWGIALDPAAGKIYWANYLVNKISWANLDGSAGGDLTTGAATVNLPAGVVVDHVAGKIYWANYTGNRISWAKLDGSEGGDLNTGTATVTSPLGVAIDSAAGKIYWANYGGNKISFAKLDNSGGGDLNIIGTTVNQPWGVTVDATLGKVFWGNFQTNALDFAGLDGTGGGVLPTAGAAQAGPMAGVIDPDTGKIYWANWSNGTIVFANVDGSGAGGTLYPSPATQTAMPTVLKSPKGTAAPAITAPGSVTPTTLSCSQGTWGANLLGNHLYRAPRSFAYQWTRDGAAIGGATSASVAASTPGAYRCAVTATNAAGSTSQTSSPLTVTAPPPPPPPPPPTLIPSTVGNNWAASRAFTTVVTLSARKLPAGATVVVACKTKKKSLQKKRCPFKSKTFKAPTGKSQVNLAKPFRKKKLPLGTAIKITITGPGFIGKVFTYTTRKRAAPKLKLLCLAPGATTPGKCS
jgi:DNA-binding beta-propeller fold protein YncE